MGMTSHPVARTITRKRAREFGRRGGTSVHAVSRQV